MKKLPKLLEVSSSATAETFRGEGLPVAITQLLMARNGFKAFEGALEVFPSVETPASYGAKQWNEEGLWRRTYGALAPRGFCFAQDAFGMQFVLDKEVSLFDPETGQCQVIAQNIEGWAEKLLENFNFLTGHSIMVSWQKKNGPIHDKCRLVPKVPFVLGGEFEIDNLLEMDAASAMRSRGNLARQLVDVPEGGDIRYVLTP